MPQPASPAPLPTTSPRLVLRQLSKYFDRFTALNRLELAVEPGEFVVVLGRNGAGKTTLLRTLALLLAPSEGELFYDGCRARSLDTSFRRRLGFVGHETFLYDELTAEENLLFTARLFGMPDPGRRVAQVFAEMELEDRRHSLVRSLSRGLKQRLALARAWLHEPDLLLLDEPATGLDVPTRTRLHHWLAACHRSGRTVVLSSHELSESLAAATRILLLEKGRLTFDGSNGPHRQAEMRARLESAAG